MPPKIIASTKKNPWVDSWMVAGTSGHKYKVSRRADGVTFGCECKTWLYATAPKPDCQHILKKKLELAEAKLTLQMKPILIQHVPSKIQWTEQALPGEIYWQYPEQSPDYSTEKLDELLCEEFKLHREPYNNLKQNTLALYSNGGKINAIKYVFQIMKPHGWGLMESKKFCDKIIEKFSLTSISPVGTMSLKLKKHVKVEAESEGRRFRGEDD